MFQPHLRQPAPPAPQRLRAALPAHGGRDTANPTGNPTGARAAAVGLGASARPVRRLVYEHAGYSWDCRAIFQEAQSPIPHPGGGGHVEARPWPQLRATSAAEVARLFATSLAP
jgi:hypothetical protein